MKKIALITGTSSGLGLETSILLAKNNFTVYATMRDTNKKGKLLQKAQTENVEVHVSSLDVTDIDSVNRCVEEIIQRHGRIDLLINNAGAGFAKTTEQASYDEINWVTDVNYMSVVRCTKAVLPYMRKQKSGQIINISSVGGLVGQPFNEFYCAAKFAVEGYTESLATYVSSAFNIKFSVIEPGGITSEFMTSAVKNTVENGQMAKGEYLPIFENYLAGSQARAGASAVSVYQSSEEVAAVVLKVAKDSNPPLRIRTSEWANDFCELKTASDPTGKKLVEQVETTFLKN